MKRYAITEGLGTERALSFAGWNLDRGVDMLQIREKQLSARELLALVEEVLRLPNLVGTQILVNSRLDIALVAGAHGVHFPADAQILGPGFRSAGETACATFNNEQLASGRTGIQPVHMFSRRLVIGASCHNLRDLQQAADEGVNFAVFGPVFATGAKPPQGLSALREACAAALIPVYALGGITDQNAAACIEAGAIGIAGISLFRPTKE